MSNRPGLSRAFERKISMGHHGCAFAVAPAAVLFTVGSCVGKTSVTDDRRMIQAAMKFIFRPRA